MKSSIDRQGDFAAVGWAQGRSHHTYEDRFRLLTSYIPLVATSGRGDLVAVFDGVGSAPQGMQAAQALADALLGFYTVARPVVGSSGQACSWKTPARGCYKLQQQFCAGVSLRARNGRVGPQQVRWPGSLTDSQPPMYCMQVTPKYCG